MSLNAMLAVLSGFSLLRQLIGRACGKATQALTVTYRDKKGIGHVNRIYRKH